MQTNSIEKSIPETDYAPLGLRLLAYFIDSIVILGILLVFYIPLFLINFMGPILAVRYLIPAVYFIFFWSSKNNQTLGMKLLAIKVVKEDGLPVTFITSLVRYIGYFISALVLMIGFLAITWDSKRQGWHDKMARTIVVKTNAKPHTALAIAIVVALGIIYFIVAIVVGIFIVLSVSDPNHVPKMPASLQKLVPTITQNKADLNSSQAFIIINSVRKNQQLAELKMDPKLCAYATRRLNTYMQKGMIDNGKGLYEDLKNVGISNTYFRESSLVSESSYSINAFTVIPALISSEYTSKNPSPITSDEKVAIGCVVSNSKFMEIVASTL